jgi:hypothetical protein
MKTNTMQRISCLWNIDTKQIEQEKCADVENMYSERPFVMSNNELVYFEDNICCPGDVVVYDLETEEEVGDYNTKTYLEKSL